MFKFRSRMVSTSRTFGPADTKARELSRMSAADLADIGLKAGDVARILQKI